MNESVKTAIVARGYIPELARVESDRPRFAQFIAACFACQSVDQVYFAVDPKRDVGDTVAFLSALPVPTGKTLSVIPVNPWGRYVEPLNAIFSQAATDGYEAVLSVNLEHRPTDTNISELTRHLDRDTLVTGAWLPVFHEELPPGEYEMNGMRAPADAFMLVRVQKLALFGFLSVSEAPWVSCPIDKLGTPDDPAMKTAAGIKEVPTFSLIQEKLGYDQAKVKLVLGVTDAGRDTSSLTGPRKEVDDAKRRSALKRAAEQLRRINQKPGRTIYVNA